MNHPTLSLQTTVVDPLPSGMEMWKSKVCAQPGGSIALSKLGVMEGQKESNTHSAIQNSQSLSTLKNSPNIITIIKDQATRITNTSLRVYMTSN